MIAPNKRPLRLMFAQSRVISSFKSAGSLRTAALLSPGWLVSHYVLFAILRNIFSQAPGFSNGERGR